MFTGTVICSFNDLGRDFTTLLGYRLTGFDTIIKYQCLLRSTRKYQDNLDDRVTFSLLLLGQ